MKKSKSSKSKGASLSAIVKNLNTQGFTLSLIEESAHHAAYFAIPKAAKKNFVQIISLEVENDGFVSVEIFVSNLSITEIWAEIQISADSVGQYLNAMLKVAKEEIGKEVKNEAQFEKILKEIDRHEKKRDSSIDKLFSIEDQITAKATADAKLPKLLKDLAKVEEDCINEEIEVSKLSYRYLVNTLDEVDPFFFAMLFGGKKSKAKK
jgi:hypothetical protein